MTNFLTFEVMTHCFDVITRFLLHDKLLTYFWCHDKPLTSWHVSDVMTNFLTSCVFLTSSFLTLWQFFWHRDKPFDIMTSFWRNGERFACLWHHDTFLMWQTFWRHRVFFYVILIFFKMSWKHVFDVITNFLTSWRVFEFMTNFWTSWHMFLLHDVILMSWRV